MIYKVFGITDEANIDVVPILSISKGLIICGINFQPNCGDFNHTVLRKNKSLLNFYFHIVFLGNLCASKEDIFKFCKFKLKSLAQD